MMRAFALLTALICVAILPSCVSSQRRQALTAAVHDLEDDVILVARVIDIEEIQPGVNLGLYLELLVREVLQDAGNEIKAGDRIRVHVASLEYLVRGIRLGDTPAKNSPFGYLVIFQDPFDWDYAGRVSFWEWHIYKLDPPVASVATVIGVSPSWAECGSATLRIERVRVYYNGKPCVSRREYVEVFMDRTQLETENIMPDDIGGECRALYIDPRRIWEKWKQ
jgi:hypothetical protein